MAVRLFFTLILLAPNGLALGFVSGALLGFAPLHFAAGCSSIPSMITKLGVSTISAPFFISTSNNSDSGFLLIAVRLLSLLIRIYKG